MGKMDGEMEEKREKRNMTSADDRQVVRRRMNSPDDDDGEDTMSYRGRQPIEYLNDRKSVFDSKFAQGINTGESIFDSTAVFRTRGSGG